MRCANASHFLFISCFLVSCDHRTVEEHYPSGRIKSVISLNQRDLPDGVATTYYESGQIETTGEWKDGNREGTCRWFAPNGSVEMEGSYVEGEMQGEFTEYFPNGSIKTVISYSEAKKNGVARTFYPTGELQSAVQYHNGLQNDTSRYLFLNGITSMIAFHQNDTVLWYVEYDSLGNATTEFARNVIGTSALVPKRILNGD